MWFEQEKRGFSDVSLWKYKHFDSLAVVLVCFSNISLIATGLKKLNLDTKHIQMWKIVRMRFFTQPSI